jgi:GR25 family glycosyltransferase involved in LPS biosynthesis
MDNQLFDIYVINLDKDATRLEKITKQLEPNKFIRISGIYGEQEIFLENQDIYFSSRYLAPKSALGCSISHRLALKTFLEKSQKEYAVILEDDAEPTTKDYMVNIEESIKNAPEGWDIIKLDYLPGYPTKTYNKMPTLLATAYIINKKCSEKILSQKIYYYPDIDMHFFGLNIYNNPNIIFKQVWDENNNSNNRQKNNYNPFSFTHETFNYKIIRINDFEFTFADFILILFLLFCNLYFYVCKSLISINFSNSFNLSVISFDPKKG